MIISEFKAVFNPLNRELAVRYGNAVSTYQFGESEEWTKVSYNGDADHPCYLHIQLDYDECMQLLFYPREDGSQDLNEDDGTFWNSNDVFDYEFWNQPKNLELVFNDSEFIRAKEVLLIGAEKEVIVPEGL